MTFFIYRTRTGFELSNGEDVALPFANEAAAGDFAVRTAQENDALWTINYWRP